MTKLVNIYHKVPYDMYIGRAGKGQDGYFGNPIKLVDNDREECIKQYKEYFNKRIAEDQEFKTRIEGLKGKTLACFCFPKCCHGMTIIEYLEGITVEQQLKDAKVK